MSGISSVFFRGRERAARGIGDPRRSARARALHWFIALVLVAAAAWGHSSAVTPAGQTTSSSADRGARRMPPDVKARIDALSPEEQIRFLGSLERGRVEDAVVSFYIGNAYLSLSRPDSAAVFYEKALAADSAYAKAHVNLGIALEELRRFEDARLHYEAAIAIDSTDVLAYCHLGHYHHVRGDLGEAVALYGRAAAIDPESAQARYNLGLAFADARLFGEAVREWRRVVEIAPDTEIGRTAAENVRLIETYMEMDGQSETP